ncbi:hypothetical protein CEUSTIGMA_g4688.t1 [Chlamydomonas eustigma]|uniref:Uncharacterized protein n=1 Tax=Chlamydomonas eustigma TaxID=1157962 RepID=A0A250X2E6_9CHLO|nr:hypothetical protein CEUSTIGMA_g4688.t1 [Chlamydomonas eustigma]|eukprot:GAX77241.1 hypothetical protein CEUSTIGMA_g4688.t1 [Chlamydomonas eustigma]
MKRAGRLLTSLSAKPLDHLYSRISALNGPFFPQGWGDLSVVQFEEDAAALTAWPPPDLKIDWRELKAGKRDGVPFKLVQGSFRTPCLGRVYDALPPESRMGRIQMLVPEPNTSTSPSDLAPSCVLILAATGDQGFNRRLNLGSPLLKHGVTSIVLESPYYGARRPNDQRGSKLRVVSDLLTLGWATIFESICLLHLMSNRMGHDRMCISGLSMGGVHACMTAGLYAKDVACAPLLAPRSAAVAYVDGAMHAAMAWEPLSSEVDGKSNNVGEVVGNAAQAGSIMAAAKYALMEVEAAYLKAEKEGAPEPDPVLLAKAAAAIDAANAEADALQLMLPLRHPPGSYAPYKHGASSYTCDSGTTSLDEATLLPPTSPSLSSSFPLSPEHSPVDDATTNTEHSYNAGNPRGAADNCGHTGSSLHSSLPSEKDMRSDDINQNMLQSSTTATTATTAMHSSQTWTDVKASELLDSQFVATTANASGCSSDMGGSWGRELKCTGEGCGLEINSSKESTGDAFSGVTPEHHHPPSSLVTRNDAAGYITTVQDQDSAIHMPHLHTLPNSSQRPGNRLGRWDKQMLRTWLGARLQQLKRRDQGLQSARTVSMLKQVLETFTDVTRYPRPRRPDAAVLVAAKDDAYVSVESVRAVHEHWQGSEMRLVEGGHVSGFLMQQSQFRRAIMDSLKRLQS